MTDTTTSFETASPVYQLRGNTFVLNQTLQTFSASEVNPFNFNGQNFLAVTNKGNDTIGTVVHKWADGRFSEIQQIQTNYVTGVHSFMISGRRFLAISNKDWKKVSLYEWFHGSFSIKVQDILMQKVEKCCTVDILNDTYLACGNREKKKAVRVMKWTGVQFDNFQTLSASNSKGVHCFKANGSAYLAVPNGKTANYSFVYRWTDTSFALHQKIAIDNARSSTSFVALDGNTFLVIANKGPAESGYQGLSAVYKLINNQFVLYQQLTTTWTSAMCAFTHGGKLFLAVAQHYDGTTYRLNSTFYKWN